MYKNFIRSKNFALFILAMASFMSAVDGSVVNIALPVLSRYFNAGITQVQWVASIYGLGIVALLPLGAKLGNRYGQNKINSLGYFLFGLGSLLCAVSGSLSGLVISRLVQAAGAAMLFSLAQGIIVTIFTGAKRGAALGMIGSCVALGNILGPSLGGFLLDTFGWKSIFLINLPVAAFGAYYSHRILPAIVRKKLGIINITSLIYFVAAAVSFIGALSLAERAGLRSPHIITMLCAAVLFGALLYRHDSAAQHPLLNISLYKNKVFAYGNFALVLMFMGISINAVLIPFFLQDIYHLSAFKTGTLILFYSLALVVAAPVFGRMSGKYSGRWLTVGGCAITIAGLIWYMYLGAEYIEYQIIIGQIIMGIGNGMFQSPNNNSIMSAVPRRFYNDASALNSLARNVGIVSGIAMTVNIFEYFRAYFISHGLTDGAAFMRGYHYTLISGIILISTALVLSYTGKAPQGVSRANAANIL